MNSILDFAIIGAGPYGLSVAAYMQAKGLECRVFGRPMDTWLTQMPKGMRLKSEGFASTLYAPEGAFSLADYCAEHSISYAEIGIPVELDTFTSYGMAFQKAVVPKLEKKLIIELRRTQAGFRLTAEDGEEFAARKVILAIGICHYQHIPESLAQLGPDLVSHSSGRSDWGEFAGRDVVVVGGGASAVDVAASLLRSGARVQLVARKPAVRFHHPPGKLPRPLGERLRAPMTGLGPGWKSWLCTEMPLLFHRMPERFREEVVRKHLGPAPGWFVRQEVEGRIPFHLNTRLMGAAVSGGRVHLQLSQASAERTLAADHVVCGTGYHVDLARLSFLPQALRAQIDSFNGSPRLSTHFESSVPGLYFVGASSGLNFGPMVRFVYGAHFTARRLTAHLTKSTRLRVVPVSPLPSVCKNS